MKIMWAFEPFHQPKTVTKKMYGLLLALGHQAKRIEVGYVIAETAEFNAAFDLLTGQSFALDPQAIVGAEFKAAGLRIDPGRVHCVRDRSSRITANVDSLLKLAKERKSNVIALYTHSRKGIERALLGSFAETAIHRSTTNLLVVNPSAKIPEKVRSVLYASDFSTASKDDLKKVIQLCKGLKAKLTVFHAAEIIYRWSLDEKNPQIKSYRRETKAMEEWVKTTCENAGVHCTVMVKAEFEIISSLALKASQQAKADLVVVTAKVGRWAALMGGSVARQIVRDAKCPVLVLKG